MSEYAPPVDFDPCRLINILVSHSVEFIIIGGIAGILHGVSRPTYDVDVLYRRTPENLRKIADALAPYKPYLRDMPEGLPFVFDFDTLYRGLNFTLVTTEGPIDFLGSVPGAQNYDDLLPDALMMEICGQKIQVANLERLIEMKRLAGRPRDFEFIAMLNRLNNFRGKDK